MQVKQLIYEDFINYKVASMFIASPTCTFKCEKESGVCCCQNSSLAKAETINIDDDVIIKKYINNDITKAIVFGGLEPLDSFDELLSFIRKLRFEYHCGDTVVIYTGYYPREISEKISELKVFGNIVVKFGRYIPNDSKVYDAVLGVTLASKNQYAEEIS